MTATIDLTSPRTYNRTPDETTRARDLTRSLCQLTETQVGAFCSDVLERGCVQAESTLWGLVGR